MVKVEIRCPSCSKRGNIDVDQEIINESTRGVTAVNIGVDQICSHSFVAYIDKNLAVRDCFIADFQIELPQMETVQRIEEKDLPGTDECDVDLIKMNIPALQLTSIIRGCLFKKKILIVNDQDFLHDHIRNFFNFIFKNSFTIDIEIITGDSYKKNKKQYKKHLVFDGKNILNDKAKLMDPKKIKTERTIIQRFLAEYNPKSSLIIIKNEIQKAFELSKDLMDLIESYEGENHQKIAFEPHSYRIVGLVFIGKTI